MRKLHEAPLVQTLSAAAALAGVLLLSSACSKAKPLPVAQTVHQCFTGDIPSRADMRLGERPPLAVQEQPNGLLSGDYRPTAAQLKRQADATVEVVYKQPGHDPYYTTATLTRDKEGSVVAVGAGHGMGGVALSRLTLIDHVGRKLKPTSGCYVYGNSTQGNMPLPPKQAESKPSSHENTINVPNVDMGALVVSSLPEGDSTLALSGGQPTRGEWYTTTNYTGTSTQTSTYNVLALTDSRDNGGASDLSRLGPRANQPYTQAGASGGALIHFGGNDKISGIIVGTAREPFNQLQTLNVTVNYTALTPPPDYVTIDLITTGDYLTLAQGAAANPSPVAWPK